MTTSPPESSAPAGAAAPEQSKAAATLAPYREMGALVLLAANAAFLAFAVISLFTVFAEDVRVTSFSGRAGGQFGTYVGLVSIFFPLGAVLLATLIKPAAQRGKLIATGALVEYAVSAVFGLVCLFASFVQTVGADYSGAIVDAFLTLLGRLVWLVLLGFAVFVVWRLYQSLYYVPKPQPVPVPPGYPPGYPSPAYPAAYGPSGAYPTVQGYPQGYPPQAYQQGGYPPQAYPQGYPQQAYQGYPAPGYPPPPSTPVTSAPPVASGSPVPPGPPAGSPAAPRDDSPTSVISQGGWGPPAPPVPAGPPEAPPPGGSVSGPPPPAPQPPAPQPPSATPEQSDSTQLIPPRPAEQQAAEPATEEQRDQPFAGRPPDARDEPTQPWG